MLKSRLLSRPSQTLFFRHAADSSALSARIIDAAIQDAFRISRGENPMYETKYNKQESYWKTLADELEMYGIKMNGHDKTGTSAQNNKF